MAADHTTSKTERTRARLVDAAIDVVSRQGFEQTTVAQIARAAGVSEMTFFRYFPTKESVLLDDPYNPLLAAAIADQPRHRGPLHRAIGGIRHAWRDLPEPEGDATRDRVRIIAGSAALRAASWRNNEVTESIIADQLVADGADPVSARIAASACLAGITVSLLAWATAGSSTMAEHVELALDVLAGDR